MSTQDKKSPRNQKSSGLLLLNTLLAGLVGYAIWGAAGSVIGVTILLAAATGIPAATRLIGQRGPDLKKNVPRSAGFEAIKAIAKLIAFPFLMVAAIIVTALTMLVSLLLMGGHHVKNASDVSTPKRVALPSYGRHKPSTLFRNFGEPENLTLLIGNFLLLLIVGCVLFGMDVAFYAALVATPVWLMGLMLLAIQGSKPIEPAPVIGETSNAAEAGLLQHNSSPQ